jgi:hypothetical protein
MNGVRVKVYTFYRIHEKTTDLTYIGCTKGDDLKSILHDFISRCNKNKGKRKIEMVEKLRPYRKNCTIEPLKRVVLTSRDRCSVVLHTILYDEIIKEITPSSSNNSDNSGITDNVCVLGLGKNRK